ncbi:MAG TPA: sigma-70 family RNA polymerase sigma factor [Polyangiaceae bacterium]
MTSKLARPSSRAVRPPVGLSLVEPARRRDRRAAALNTTDSQASNPNERGAESERDRELIARAQRGDGAAFRELVERHRRRAFAIAVGLVRDEEDALEIVQEAFFRVYRGLSAFNGAASFFTWLYRIVKNLSIDLMRRPAWQRELALDEAEAGFDACLDHADPADVLRQREIGDRITAALEALPPYHRGVIVMREVEGMSYEEMADAMGVSKGTIMSRLFHARKKLQRALVACYAEETAAKRSSEP